MDIINLYEFFNNDYEKNYFSSNKDITDNLKDKILKKIILKKKILNLIKIFESQIIKKV